MKGVYKKQAIRDIVEPLKALTSVFENNVHVVYENSPTSIIISVKGIGVRAVYELKASEIIDEYDCPVKEVGIWEVKQFISILGKYLSDIYVDDVIIEPAREKLTISCGNEHTEYYLSDLSLFTDSRNPTRTLNTQSLTEACSFTLSGSELKKISNNISVFDEQDIFTIKSNADKKVKIRLSCSKAVKNNLESVIDSVKSAESFSLNYNKSMIKGLMSCNDEFNIKVFLGAKNIIEVSYKKENYSMTFYLAPIEA